VKVTAAPVSGACPAGRDGRARTARRPGGDRPPGRGPTLGGGIRPRRAIRSGPHRPASQESHHITSFTIDVPVIRVSRYIPAWHRAKTFFIALASAWTCIYPAPEIPYPVIHARVFPRAADARLEESSGAWRVRTVTIWLRSITRVAAASPAAAKSVPAIAAAGFPRVALNLVT
jgi:hypothetical protein